MIRVTQAMTSAAEVARASGLSEEDVAIVSAVGYDDVARELPRLDAAVKAAIAADEAEALKHSLGPDPVPGGQSLPGFSQFLSEGQERVTAVKDLLGQVMDRCAADLAVHALVPQQLDEDSQSWGYNGLAVAEKIERCQALQEVPDWVGISQQAYAQAVKGQMSALKELAGVYESAARGCAAGATLNRAVFFAVSKAIIAATNRINTPHRGGGEYFFVRTAGARSELEDVLSKITNAVGGDVAAGSVTVLSGELRRAKSMPELLASGRWPSGTDYGDVAPADTGDAVATDGSDVETDVGATGGQCYVGVDGEPVWQPFTPDPWSFGEPAFKLPQVNK